MIRRTSITNTVARMRAFGKTTFLAAVKLASPLYSQFRFGINSTSFFTAAGTVHTKTMRTMSFVDSSTDNTGLIFPGPLYAASMKIIMSLSRHYFKITQIIRIVESIPVLVMDYFTFFQLTAKMLLHHPSVFEDPNPRGNFNFYIQVSAAVNNPFGK